MSFVLAAGTFGPRCAVKEWRAAESAREFGKLPTEMRAKVAGDSILVVRQRRIGG